MSEAAPPALKLGTFIGVFTPTVLTILGVIMYLRFGWVVGNAGLYGTLAIVILSNAITFFTALSMSQLATNMRVGVGGAYFLISRSFGLELGGAIGIPLYLSQVLSVTLYAYGLAEIPTLFVEMSPGLIQLVACGIIASVTLVAARSTELTLKAQIPILGLIALSLVAFFGGIDFSEQRVDNVGPWPDAGFWQVFAVFFPAVTGVLTGLSMSGDLEDPSRSIPRGVVSAVIVGALVYVAVPIGLAFAAPPEALRTDSLLWTSVAVGGPLLVLPGMIGAVLSSALGSVLSAPRTLQALAGDRLAPGAFALVEPRTGEPLNGLRMSGGLALAAAILLPDLNAVASMVTVFFLTTYGALNAVSALEKWIGDPGFRPRIKVHWGVSLLGAIGCFAAMFLISPVACAIAIGLEVLIFVVLSRRSLESTWGDARGGLLLTGARFALLSLRRSRLDPRNWRPHILVLTTDLQTCLPAVALAESFGQHRGIVTVAHMLLGDLEGDTRPERVRLRDERLLEEHDLYDAFPEVTVVPDAMSGATTIAQANGIAGLQSNTAMFVVPRAMAVEGFAELLALTRRMALLRLSTILFRPPTVPPSRPPGERTILVWWAGRENNGDLMLLLAHLLTLSREWSRARIELKTVVDDEDQASERARELARLVPEIRIDVGVEVIRRGDEDVLQLIVEQSRSADLVFLGLAVPARGEEPGYAERMLTLVDQLPSAVLVKNASRFNGRLV